ncbi:LptF/LptG family permease [Desulfurobacterium atlanticum]|uniref:Lipopolysaccharide export system permease protein n=1 Tax=Desulfurobacterium atlanticum TaxID=240169 RepID=A0A238XK05_9BACT|nr:LptF/LptG family permease [Desulfurobacterium atlanticum]SNR59022.1 lipopolysaccharide export system permease protein [Desulfurobacterium atlanticum]
MKVLHRYILSEIIRYFFLFIAVFILIMLMNKASFIAKTVLGYGVSFSSLFSVLVKTIPSFFEFLIPMSLVFAVLVTFFLLSGRNEIVAVKSCGISVKELAKPVIVFSIVLTIFNFFSVMYLVPESNVAMKREIQELVRKKLSLGIIPGKFISNFPGVTFYAESVYPSKGILKNFMVSVVKKDEQATIFAKYGRVRMTNGTVFLDIDTGIAHFLNWKRPENLKILEFKTYTLVVYKFASQEKFEASKYKTLNELFKRWNLKDRLEFFKRLTLAVSPVIMGLFAFSIAVVIPRGSIGTGILVGLIVIVSYYVFFTFLRKAAQFSGFVFLPVFVDIVYFSVGLIFYKKAINENYFNMGIGRW